jgi:hypothetical protein
MIYLGLIDIGGVRKVFEIAMDGNRIQLAKFVDKISKEIIYFVNFFSVKFDLSIRYTVWSVIIGGSFYTTAVYSCLQTQAQRYMCVKNIRSAQKYRFSMSIDLLFFFYWNF